MDNDFEIEIQETNAEDTNSVQLPLNFLTFGEIENDDVKVYIKQDVYKALEKLASSDTTKELGSIILGEYTQELGKTHIIISEYIEAKYTDASASTLTFTHETWDYVHKEHEKKYPEKKIIGWQHTHPNYGIFLSNYDLFIQENFFNMPFQIAYVIDPIQNIRGFFQWKNGRIEKLKGYYIYDDIGKPIKIEQTKPASGGNAANGVQRPPKWTVAIIALLCAATVALSISVVSLNKKYNEQLATQEMVLGEIDKQTTIINEQNTTISTLQEQIDGGDAKEEAPQVDYGDILESHEATLQSQDETLKEIIARLDGEGVSTVRFSVHTVAPGDSLMKICEEHGIDFHENREVILTINNISNPDIIAVGQNIFLPVFD